MHPAAMTDASCASDRQALQSYASFARHQNRGLGLHRRPLHPDATPPATSPTTVSLDSGYVCRSGGLGLRLGIAALQRLRRGAIDSRKPRSGVGSHLAWDCRRELSIAFKRQHQRCISGTSFILAIWFIFTLQGLAEQAYRLITCICGFGCSVGP